MKITKAVLKRIIKEEVLKESRRQKYLNEVALYKGFYVTSREPFLEAVRDMVKEVETNGRDVQAALARIEQNVDQKQYDSGISQTIRQLEAGYQITGLYVTTREKFLEAMTDAGELAAAETPVEDVVQQIEANVDQGKYSDPRTRDVFAR